MISLALITNYYWQMFDGGYRLRGFAKFLATTAYCLICMAYIVLLGVYYIALKPGIMILKRAFGRSAE